jgi:hypothetical protein
VKLCSAATNFFFARPLYLSSARYHLPINLYPQWLVRSVHIGSICKIARMPKERVTVSDLALRLIKFGMVFGEDVRSAKGVLLIARGQEVTPSLIERVRNFSPALEIREPVRMFGARSSLRRPTSSLAKRKGYIFS